jgi:hypothetical protein
VRHELVHDVLSAPQVCFFFFVHGTETGMLTSFCSCHSSSNNCSKACCSSHLPVLIDIAYFEASPSTVASQPAL